MVPFTQKKTTLPVSHPWNPPEIVENDWYHRDITLETVEKDCYHREIKLETVENDWYHSEITLETVQND